MTSVEQRIDRLESALTRLAEAQIETEKRLGALTQRVDRLTELVDQLTVAIGRLEEQVERIEVQISKLTSATDELRKAVGAFSETVGFGLEDIARVVLPGWIERHLGIRLDNLDRKYFKLDGGEIEANLYGEGIKDGQRIVVIAEVRSRIYERDVEEFSAKVEVIAQTIRLDTVKIMFGYLVHPTAEQPAKQHSIHLVASYHR